MNGRLENELIILNKVENKLKEMPRYVEDWYYALRASDCTATTCSGYVNQIHLFMLYLNKNTKEVKLSDITKDSVNGYIISKRTTERNGEIVETSISTRKTIWFALNNFLGYLYDSDLINENYMQNIRKPKNNRQPEPKTFLNEDDFRKMLIAARQSSTDYFYKARNYGMIYLLMATGLRVTALRSINVDDIDWDNNTLTVIDKGDKTQTYYITEDLMDKLENVKDHRNDYAKDSPALFITKQGKRISKEVVEDLLVKISKGIREDGKPISPHQIRAGFCSIIYNKTKDIEFVRRAVGHSDVSTTMRYIVTENKEREKSSNLITNIFN